MNLRTDLIEVDKQKAVFFLKKIKIFETKLKITTDRFLVLSKIPEDDICSSSSLFDYVRYWWR